MEIILGITAIQILQEITRLFQVTKLICNIKTTKIPENLPFEFLNGSLVVKRKFLIISLVVGNNSKLLILFTKFYSVL